MKNFTSLLVVFLLPVAGFGQYCVPTYGNLCSSDDFINNFTLSTLSVLNSGCNGNPDNYFLDLSATTGLCVGGIYNMTMQSGSAWSQGFGVWIDYNQDGDFGDTLEFVYASPTSSTALFSTTVSVPLFALSGTTRLRVRCAYATTLTAADTCTNFTYGETEDYNISILAPSGPIISLSAICLNYDTVFAGGTYYDTLVVTNLGCDTLIVSSISSSLPQFAPDTNNLSLLPGEVKNLIISFAPDSTISYSGTLTILNNDNDTSVCLTGTGEPSPVISVNPSSLSANLGCNDSITLPFVISNTGGSNLTWNVTVPANYSDDFDPGIDLSLWTSTSGVVSTNCGPFSGNGLYFDDPGTRYAETIDLNATGPGNISFYLMLPQGLAPCEAADASTESVDLEYSINGGVTWSLINTYLNSAYPSLTFITEPIPPGAQTSSSRFRWIQQSHSGSGFDNWIIDNVSIDIQSGCGACACASPQSGITPPSGADTVYVEFNSSGLVTGLYIFQLLVNSNDPVNPLITIACTLTVSGPPQLSYSDSCLLFGTIMENTTGTMPLILYNTGCDTLTGYGLSSSAYFSLDSIGNDSTGGIILPGDSVLILVIFSPTSPGSYTGSVNLTSDGGNASVCLNGTAFPMPVICYDPDSFNVNFSSCADSVIVPLAICNSGGTILSWDINALSSVNDDFDPAIDMLVWSSTTGIVNTNCGPYSGNGLWFDDPGIRQAQTIDLNTIGGGTISFYIMLPQLGSPCEAADSPGEDVTLEYSNDGGFSWIGLDTFIYNLYPTLTFVSLPIPAQAQSSSTRFQWRQLSHSGSGFDNWLLDNVSISVSGSYTPVPSTGSTIPGDTTMVNIIFTSTGLSAGSYNFNVQINSNDPLQPQVNIPAVVNVADSMSMFLTAANVTCNSYCNGSVAALVTGGASPLTYLWDAQAGGQTTPIASGLCAGTFIVTVTDAAGCTKTGSVSVTQPVALSVTIAPSNINCNGACNGSAAATVTGWGLPYTYIWSDPSSQTTSSATGLCSGSYTVTVTNSAGCSRTASTSLTQPSALTVATTSTNAACGNSDGTATATVGGGTAPYSYLWNDPAPQQTTSTAVSLAAGGYVVTVTDSKGCTMTGSATVNNVGGPVLTFNKTDVACNGGTSGSASASASGGTPPYSYNWSSGQTGTAASGLPAGVVFVSVTDNNGCMAAAGITITEPPALIATITSQTNILCNGGNNGSATVSVTGGITPYNYLWINAQTSATASGLMAGNYTVTVTDNKGCTKSANVTITQPTALAASVTVLINVTCNGGMNGAISATAAGGTGSYSYLWNSTPPQTISIANGLAAGTYSVTITDANNCTATSSATVTQPSPLVLTVNTTTANCGSQDGTATVTVSGGNPAYTYLWNDPAPQQSTSTATGLAAGGYIVTITDANNCSKTATASVNNSTGPVLTFNGTDVDCNGGNTGAASVTASGGNPPYTYVWNTTPAQTTTNATGLQAGVYFVSVNDNNNCLAVAGITLTEPTALSAIVTSQVNVSCNGGNNGSATISAGGGVAPYYYLWSTTPAQTSQLGTGLAAGNFQVTVSDNNSCTVLTNVTMTEPSSLTSWTIIQANVTCNGGNDGAAAAPATGGTPPYSYQWSSGATTSSVNLLTASTYTVTVTDANTCTSIATTIITEPGALALVTSSTTANCGLPDGSATVNVTGGVAPYSYLWNDPAPQQTTSTATGLSAGGYFVTVTDANGCTNTGAAAINNAGGPVATPATTDVGCNGDSTGSADVTATGGTPPYTYSWSTTPAQTTSSATGLAAGNYFVTITDNSSCLAVASVVITEPAPLSSSIVTSDATCGACADGAADLTVNGGIAPYSYSWNTGSSAEDIAGLLPGNYSVTITDANGCTATDNIVVDFSVGKQSVAVVYEGITIFPNPARDMLAISTSGGNGKVISAIVYNPTGQCISAFVLGIKQPVQTLDVSNWSEGLYYIRFISDDHSSFEWFVIMR